MRDIKAEVTGKILEQLEQGTAPWRCGWNKQNPSPLTLPMNYTTGYYYKGINIPLLWQSTLEHDFATNDWASVMQWNKDKQSIRPGEKGTMIVYYDTFSKDVDGEIKDIPFIKTSVVFNRSQLKSWEPETEIIKEPLIKWDEEVNAYVKNVGVPILYDGVNQAYYRPSTDDIHLPKPSAFIGTETQTPIEALYSVTGHELTHATGHKDRLAREFGKRFGDNAYAQEELVAEMGAAFFCAKHNITDGPRPDHASYLSHWIDILKTDSSAIISAASHASKAIDFMDSKQPQVQ